MQLRELALHPGDLMLNINPFPSTTIMTVVPTQGIRGIAGSTCFGEHDMGQEAIRKEWQVEQKLEAKVWSLERRRSEIGGRRPDDRTIRWSDGRTKGGWTVKPKGQRWEDLGPNEDSRELWVEVRAGEARTGGRRYPEHNPEGHGQSDDQRKRTRGEAMTNKRKKSKPEEVGRRELAGEGIKPWK
ncbi:hypothetical protein DFH08DRAFT_806045 [Mycena albidolilacea]|uniref:Uncharacterized protein n=1 Tax=Mycena albidolilacea TaxID=1033008 RepID=A0AAD7EU28_9AGAR|nr:hypothetical protein DFH08DRAFT_806045 [Mycena albidolilacea]